MINIKFKAWDKESRKMRSVESIAFDKEGKIKVVNMWGYNIIEDKPMIINLNTVKKIKRVELLMCTGIVINGTELCMKDIFHLGDNDVKYMVVWHKNGFKGQRLWGSSYIELDSLSDEAKCLGNVYEMN